VMGELGSSHAYVQPALSGNHGGRRPVGMLGADLDRDPDGGWRVTRILPGESSDPRALSPLAAPGAGITPGDRIMAIDGQLLGVRGERPENITYPGVAEPLQQVWIALRANERAVLEQVTLADIVSGNLPDMIRNLTENPSAWV